MDTTPAPSLQGDRYSDNPAGRLLSLLTQVRSAEGRSQAAQVWADAIGLELPADEDQLNESGLFLRRSASTIRKRLDAGMVSAPSGALDNFDEIERTLENFERVDVINIALFLLPLSKAGFESLSQCADVLHAYDPEPVIPDDNVSQLLIRVRETIDEVQDSDMDPRLKEWLLERLADVEKALRLYKVSGFPAVERAFLDLVGGLHLRPSFVERIATSPRAQGIALLVALFSGIIQSATSSAALYVAIESRAQPPAITSPRHPGTTPTPSVPGSTISSPRTASSSVQHPSDSDDDGSPDAGRRRD